MTEIPTFALIESILTDISLEFLLTYGIANKIRFKYKARQAPSYTALGNRPTKTVTTHGNSWNVFLQSHII